MTLPYGVLMFCGVAYTICRPSMAVNNVTAKQGNVNP